jgi:hypothetical protein
VSQDALFPQPKPVAVLRALTARQAEIYAFVCSIPGGITADELGALLHDARGKHAADARCEFCGRDGARALRERGIAQRVIRRTGSIYEAREPADRADPPSAQIAALPGESWEEIFGGREEAA